MTAQTMFNRVAKHLLTQGRQSILAGTPLTCAYRSPEGLRCAVGCLIPQRAYRPSFERRGVRKLLRTLSRAERQAPWAKRIRANMELAYSLQVVHDSYPPNKWEEMLDSVAACHGLKPYRKEAS